MPPAGSERPNSQFRRHPGNPIVTAKYYYGGADTAMCLATASVERLLSWLKDHGRPGGIPRDE